VSKLKILLYYFWPKIQTGISKIADFTRFYWLRLQVEFYKLTISLDFIGSDWKTRILKIADFTRFYWLRLEVLGLPGHQIH
jgi:hypothetical protein